VLVFAGLVALGVTMLRQQAALEFPEAQPGDALRQLKFRRPAVRPAAAGRDGGSARLDELERLVVLHDRGDLTDEEFAVEKTHLAGAPHS
jgi:hypothetical protein